MHCQILDLESVGIYVLGDQEAHGESTTNRRRCEVTGTNSLSSQAFRCVCEEKLN